MNNRITILLTLLFLMAPAMAAQGEYLLSEKTYRALSAAQELMEAERYTQAGQQLDTLLRSTESGSYDRAVVLQTIGYLHSAQGQYNRAADAFRQALDSNALPEDVSHDLRYNLAQLLIADGQYQRGIPLLEQWISNESGAPVNAHVLLASAYYQVSNFGKAIEHIRIAISRDAQPKEEWLRLQLASHMELKQYDAAAGVLERLITRHPYQKSYWDQLAALYAQQNKEMRTLAVRMLARRLELGDAQTLMNLSDMYRYLQIPFKAGQLLEQGMADGLLSADLDTLRKLADSWLAARELKRAADVLQRMLGLDRSGGSHLKLGQVLVTMEAWSRAVAPLTAALELLSGPDLGRAHLLLGMAQFNLGEYQLAQQQFGKAIGFEAQSRQAAQWLRHVEATLGEDDDGTSS